MSPDRCACRECGGITLIPNGTVIMVRGKSMRVAPWAQQDHYNVPCIDAEGAVGIARTHIDGGPGYDKAECARAALRAKYYWGEATNKADRERLWKDHLEWERRAHM